MFSCLIVDDEMPARSIIKNYCSHLPQLQVAGECGNAIEAKKVLQQHIIDILFLDIHMPVLDGMAFLRTLKQPPQVIFTTAYKEHAVTAFDLAACDYLVKPFSLERFMIAVERATEKLQQPAVLQNNTPAGDYFFIKADGIIHKLLYNDIFFAEARGNYTRIVTKGNTVIPNISFSSVEAMLPADNFIRIHRSFIINKANITRVEGNTVFICKYEVPISLSYKDAFLKMLKL